MSNVRFTTNLDPDLAVACDNCDWKGTAADVEDIVDVQERVCAGEVCPAGQCPECGAVAHLVEKDTP